MLSQNLKTHRCPLRAHIAQPVVGRMNYLENKGEQATTTVRRVNQQIERKRVEKRVMVEVDMIRKHIINDSPAKEIVVPSTVLTTGNPRICDEVIPRNVVQGVQQIMNLMHPIHKANTNAASAV